MQYPNWYNKAQEQLDSDFEEGSMTYNEYRFELREINAALDEMQPKVRFEDQYA